MKITLRVQQNDGQEYEVTTKRCKRGNRKPFRRGSYSRQLAEVLVVTGYWPHHIPFDSQDLATVIDVLNEQAKESKRGRKH
jgi:hypothetical protein